MAANASPTKALEADSPEVCPGKQHRRPRGNSLRMAPLGVLGVGCGGVDELRENLDSTNVQWGLIRAEIGSGNFQRTKFVSLCCNGEDCPSFTRARHLTRTQEVLNMFGAVHANIELTNRSELTVESFLERLLPLFTADHMNISNLHQQYAQSVQQAVEHKKNVESLACVEASPLPSASDNMVSDEGTKTKEIEAERTTETPATLDEALEVVSAEYGRLNWVVFQALTFELHSTGNGGFEEMRSALDEDKVLFGLLRLSFKHVQSQEEDTSPQTQFLPKYVLLHSSGPLTPAVKRGKGNARLDNAKELIRQRVVIALAKTVLSPDELDLADIISDLQRFGLGQCGEHGGGILWDLATLAEEQEARARVEAGKTISAASDETGVPSEEAVQGAGGKDDAVDAVPEPGNADEAVPEAVDVRDALPEPADAITEVRKPAGIYNWVLVAPMRMHESAEP